MVRMHEEGKAPRDVAPVPSLTDLFGKASASIAPSEDAPPAGGPTPIAAAPSIQDLFGKASASAASSEDASPAGGSTPIAAAPSIQDLFGKASTKESAAPTEGLPPAGGSTTIAPAPSMHDLLASAARSTTRDEAPQGKAPTFEDLGWGGAIQDGNPVLDTADLSAEAWVSSYKGTTTPALSLSALKAAAKPLPSAKHPTDEAVEHMQRTFHAFNELPDGLEPEAMAALSAQDAEQRRALNRHLAGLKVEHSGSKHSLRRRFDRERKARLQAEGLIEEASRDLYLAKEATQRALTAEQQAKDKVEQALLNLNAAVKAADNAEQRRRALLITGGIGVVLYIVSEFVIDATIEANLEGPGVVMAKLSILMVLLPLQMIVERLSVKTAGAEGDSVREHLFADLLRVLLEDELLTEKELRTIDTFRVHHGFTHSEATEVLHKVMDDLGIEHGTVRL